MQTISSYQVKFQQMATDTAIDVPTEEDTEEDTEEAFTDMDMATDSHILIVMVTDIDATHTDTTDHSTDTVMATDIATVTTAHTAAVIKDVEVTTIVDTSRN